MASKSPSPDPDLTPELPPWAGRLARHVGGSVFLWFVGGFVLLTWLGRELRAAILTAWGLLLLVLNVAAWAAAGRRDRDAGS